MPSYLLTPRSQPGARNDRARADREGPCQPGVNGRAIGAGERVEKIIGAGTRRLSS